MKMSFIKSPGMLFLVCFTLMSLWGKGQTTGDYRSNAATGSWSTLATWQRWSGASWLTPTVGQGYPGQNASPALVTIQAGHVITLDVSPANGIGALDLSSSSTSSSLTFSAANILSITNNVTVNGASLNNNQENLLDVASGSLIIGGTLTVSGSNTGANTKKGTLQIGSGTVDVTGNITTSANVNGSIVFASGTLFVGTGFTIGNASGITVGTGTINFDGAAQTVPGFTYYNLTLRNSGNKTISTGITVNGTLSMQGTAAAITNAPTYGAGATLEYKGSSSQTATAIEFPSASGPTNLIIDNSSGVISSLARTISGTLTLNAGTFTNTNFTLASGATISRNNGSLANAPTFTTTVNVIYTSTGATNTGNEIPVTTTILNGLSITGSGTVSLTTDATAKGAISLSGGSLTVNASKTLTSSSTGSLTVASGKILTISNTGTVINQAITSMSLTGASAITVSGGGTYVHNTASGGIATQLSSFNMISTSNFIYRGASGAIPNTSFTGKTYGGNLSFESTSGSYTVTATGSSVVTIGGNLTIGANVTLDFITGGTPFTGNVSVAGTTTIASSGSFTTNSTGQLISTGTVTINGTLTMNSDVTVGGDWIVGAAGTQTNNSKAVFFNGTGTQTITRTGGGNVTFNYLVQNKASGDIVISSSPATDVIINSTAGAVFQMNNAGQFDLNGRTLTLSGTNGNIQVNNAVRTIKSGTTDNVAGGKLAISGTKAVTNSAGSGSLSLGVNVTVVLTADLDFGVASLSTVNGTVLINSGGSITINAPVYASGSLLNINTGGAFALYNNGTSKESAGWYRNTASTGSAQQGVPWNFSVTGSTSVTWNSVADANPRYLNGDFTLGSGASFTLGTASLGDLYVRGNFSNSGTFNANGRLVTLQGGATAQTITNTAATVFAFLTLNNSNGITSSGNFSVANTMTVSASCTFTPAAADIISGGAGTLTGNGTVKVTRTTATADFSSQYTITTKTLTDLTVDYNGAGQVLSNLTYGSAGSGGLKVSGSISTGTNNSTVAGTFTVTGTFTPSGGTVTMSGTGWGISNSGTLSFSSLTIAGTPATQPASSYTVASALTVNSGVSFTPTGGTITMSGAPGSITNSGTTLTFSSLTVSGTITGTGNFGVASAMTVNGTFTPAAADIISGAGTLTGNGTVKVTRTAATADFSSQYTITTKTLTNLTVDYNGTGQVLSNLTYGSAGSGGLKVSGSISTGTNTSTVAGTFTVTGTFTPSGGTITMSGTGWGISNSGTLSFSSLTIAGTPATQPASSYTIASALTVNSGVTFTPTAGTITMSGAPGSISNSGTTLTFSSLTVSGTITGSGNFSVASAMTVNGTFTPAAADIISGAGTLAGSGTAQVTRVTGSNNFATQYTLTKTLTSLLVEFAGSGAAQSVDALTYTGGLKISNSSGASLNGSVTTGTLNLNTGNLSIGSNILTINGAVSRTSGNLSGSNTSNLTIGGTAGSLFFASGSTNNYLKNLTLNTGATATLGNALNITAYDGSSSEGSVTVTGTATLTTAGFLTLKSSSSGTARVGQGRTTGGYISGNVVVERFIPQNTYKGWRLLAAPTSGQTVNAAWQEGQSNNTSNTNAGFGTDITAPGASDAAVQALGFDKVSPGYSLFRYDPATDNLIGITNTLTTNVNSWPGYFLFVRGDRSSNGQLGGVALNNPATTATTLRTTGSLYTGNQTGIANVVAGQYGLVGNPFASRLDMRNITLGGGMVDAFQVWDPKLTGGSGYGAYQTFTRSGANYIVTPGLGSYGSTGSIQNFLESGAAFFMQALGSTGTIVINESAKATGSSVVNRPSGTLSLGASIITNLYAINTSSTDLADGNLIQFDASFSNGIDVLDVRKSPNFGENFGILKANTDLVVERRPILHNPDTIFFNMNQLRQISYKIEILPSELSLPGLMAFLKDSYLNSMVPVSLTNTTIYNFTVDANAGSKAASRFKIVFKSQDVTWTGNISNIWSVDGNWNTLSKPLSADNIIINSGTPQLDVDFSVAGTLTVSGTGTLAVNPGKTLDITSTGIADFGGKLVTFKSDGTGTASLGKVLGTLNGATNVTVERYIPDNGFRSWRFLSVPTFGNGQTIRQAWQEGTANPNPLDNNLANFGTQITGTGALGAAQAAGFDNTGATPALLTWNGTGWSGVTTTNTAIANNKAYFLYIRGERSKGVSGLITNASATTLRTNGTVYTGSQVTPSIPAGSFGVVSNLYPSAIDFDALGRSSSVGKIFYVWDSKKSVNNSLGVYQTFDGDLGYPTLIGGGSYGATNQIIESGQAFFVKTDNSGPGTVTLTEASKVSGTNGSLGFRPSAPANIPAALYSRLYSVNGSNSTVADVNVVKFDNAYTNAIDGHDALKLSNTGENFAIDRDNSTLAIEGRQPAAINDMISFKMWNLLQQQYKLEFQPSNMGGWGLTAELEDNYLHTSTPVDLGITTSINFTVNADAASSAANRFRMVFRPQGPLPVTFTAIKALQVNNNVALEWKVANQVNISGYEVMKSRDGRNFTAVATQTARNISGGTVTYNWLDENVESGTTYYRVKSIGSSGQFNYTGIIKIQMGNGSTGITVSPNPVKGNPINISFSNQQAGKYSISLINAAGQVLYSSNARHNAGSASQSITLPSLIPNGAYQLQVVLPDNTKKVQQLILDQDK